MHVQHLVDAVMLDTVSGIFIGNQVIVFVVPGKAPWRDFVQIAAFLGNKLFLYIPGTVLKADLFVLRNRRVDDIDICIDSLVVRLGAIVNVDLALKPGGVFYACKSLQFFNQLVCLASCDEFGGLYCVHEQFQFRKAEDPFLHVVAMRVSFDLFDLETCMDECINIGVYSSPVAGTLIVILEDPNQILGIQDMLFVRAHP